MVPHNTSALINKISLALFHTIRSECETDKMSSQRYYGGLHVLPPSVPPGMSDGSPLSGITGLLFKRVE